MVNEAIVTRLLANIEAYVADLVNADDITLDIYLHDVRAQRFFERTLQIAVEAVIDVAHHLISDGRWREPASYADAFIVLAEHGVIDPALAARCRLMAQFRNKVVHYYEKIDPELVFTIARRNTDDFSDFVAAVRTWMPDSR